MLHLKTFNIHGEIQAKRSQNLEKGQDGAITTTLLLLTYSFHYQGTASSFCQHSIQPVHLTSLTLHYYHITPLVVNLLYHLSIPLHTINIYVNMPLHRQMHNYIHIHTHYIQLDSLGLLSLSPYVYFKYIYHTAHTHLIITRSRRGHPPISVEKPSQNFQFHSILFVLPPPLDSVYTYLPSKSAAKSIMPSPNPSHAIHLPSYPSFPYQQKWEAIPSRPHPSTSSSLFHPPATSLLILICFKEVVYCPRPYLRFLASIRKVCSSPLCVQIYKLFSKDHVRPGVGNQGEKERERA